MNSASHFNSTNVSLNQYVNVGDIIGTIGMTGNGTGPHVHCALYKNINTIYESNLTAKQVIMSVRSLSMQGNANNWANDFIFDAVENGSGGGQIETAIVTSTDYLICRGANTTLTAPLGSTYFWNT